MPKATRRSKALVPAGKPGASKAVAARKTSAMTSAERQKKKRAIASTGQVLVQGLVLDEATIYNGLYDKFWIEREDGDDPKKLVAGFARWVAYMLETDEDGNFFRMPNAPDAMSRVTAIKIKIC